jgi:abortive infection bacteriophage resistance protein
VKKYKDLGWIILNKTKTGGIGGDILKWTKEKCQEESLKYKIRSEFQKKSISAYCAAQRNKWLDEICSHMIPFTKPRKYWTFDRCKEEALKYKNKSEFREKSQAYYSGWNNKWLDEICSHMIETKKPKEYWTFDRCKEEALKYKTRSELQKKSASAYSKSLKNKWLNEICFHMNN